jgi:hypothetical protein
MNPSFGFLIHPTILFLNQREYFLRENEVLFGVPCCSDLLGLGHCLGQEPCRNRDSNYNNTMISYYIYEL